MFGLFVGIENVGDCCYELVVYGGLIVICIECLERDKLL